MELTPDNKQHIKLVGNETLEKFERIASAATSKLREIFVPGADVFASVNTLTSGQAVNRLGQINQANRDSYEILAKEPAIARIVVTDEKGKRHTYYICRTTPLTEIPNFASYRAPIGRLASLPAGEELRLPNGSVLEVMERAQLRPHLAHEGWDSRNTIIEAGEFGPVTIESLRAFLEEISRATPSVLDELLAEEELKANVVAGVRRNVITKMGLRDQPVLDQYQDEIFRLPLDRRLLILGAPGTGKTTTLIRRLGQKLDTQFLDEDEQRIVASISETNGAKQSDSWLMFTPTELLKQYLKEAFAREGVAASDLRIRTWNDYRRELARNTFGVLRTASGSGTFVLKESILSITENAIDHTIDWFTDFDEWQRATFLQELEQAAQSLGGAQTQDVSAIGRRLIEILGHAKADSLINTFPALDAVTPAIQKVLFERKAATDEKIKGSLNLQVNRDRAFLDQLAEFIDSLQMAQQAAEVEEEEEPEAEEEEEANFPRTGRIAAMNAFMQAVRAQARAHAAKRTLGKNSRNGKIIEWLGQRTLDASERVQVGSSLLVQASARRFVNPVKRYLSGIPRRYRAFRRLRQQEEKWYLKDAFLPTDLHPLELDVVLLAILRGAGEMLARRDVSRQINNARWSVLKPVMDLYKNQILVDEATDFSPVQLACMAALAHPRMHSFFACGDFNQRLTVWGSRSADDVRWVFPDFDIKEVTVAYRQSRQLNALARAIIRVAGGNEQHVTLPEHMDNEGVAPVLKESGTEVLDVANWLAERIREIERFVGQLPSTAVFVNSEAEVGPLAEALNINLSNDNIRAIACPQGQVMGQDNDVRVFDIQYIKGLEFEAVFFVAIDRLATLQPKLFDKYLYVGTTRAATYLGLTCEKALPAGISSLRPMFVTDWKGP